MRRVIVARVWRLHRLSIGAFVAAVVLRCFPRPIDVPGRSGGVEWVLVPVVPAALASLVPTIARRADHTLERMSGRFDAGGRMVVVAVVSLVISAGVALGVGGVRVADVRNCALAVGVSLLAIRVVPPALDWVPAVLLGAVTWLIGVPPPGAQPPQWAVLLAPGSSWPALLVALGALTTGGVLYLSASHSWGGAPASA